MKENLSTHEEKAYVNRSMNMKRTVHDVTTAYVAETDAAVLRARNQSLPKISIGCGQIAPAYLRDRNPVKREKIPDKRHRGQPSGYLLWLEAPTSRWYASRHGVRRVFAVTTYSRE